LAIIGSFIHLNIQFNVARCKGSGGPGYDCVGRNLAWLTSKELTKDINEEYWRSVFSLEPDIFVNIWTPFAFAFLAFCQNFHGYKWDAISGTWMRCLMFIIFWQLFGVIGYSANWGVFVGLWGILWLGILYSILVLVKLLKGDEFEQPVIQLELAYYFYVWFGIGNPNHIKLQNNNNSNNERASFTRPEEDVNATSTYQDVGYHPIPTAKVQSPKQTTIDNTSPQD